MPFLSRAQFPKMRLTAFVACFCFARAVAVAYDAHGATVEVDMSAKSLSVHQSKKDEPTHTPIARSERSNPPAQLELAGNTASKDASKDEMEHAFASSGKSASQDGSAPYFVGNWNGYRNNWYGDVGFAFVPEKDFLIVSLGRHVHNETGMHDTVPVTLWSVQDEMALGKVIVGPDSDKEGHYRWGSVDEPGITVFEGREYRLSQACSPGMADKWYDHEETAESIAANAATGYAHFVGGVNQSGWGYPAHSNGQYRRPGMVNFKFKDLPTNLVTGEVDNGLENAGGDQNSAHHSTELCVTVLLLSVLHLLMQ